MAAAADSLVTSAGSGEGVVASVSLPSNGGSVASGPATSANPLASPCVSVMPTEFMGYAIEYSPFDGSRVAIATAQHFGIIGNGRCIIASSRSAGGAAGSTFSEVAAFDTRDGVYDIAWSECVDGQIAFACGDGSVKLWDTRQGSQRLSEQKNLLGAAAAVNPSLSSLLRDWKEHKAEVYSVDWNLINKESIISGAWDNTIKLWHPNYTQSIRTFKEHSKCIYSTIFHPRHAELFISASGDGTVKIWDTNGYKSSRTVQAHNFEILTVDWSKYHEHLFATGSVDKSIRLFDMRNASAPIAQLDGHQFAVRRVKFSPHSASVLASVSYDMSMALWDFSLEDALLSRCDDHTEFVLGLDFNNFNDSQIVTCSWDETVRFWNIGGALAKSAIARQRKAIPPAAAAAGPTAMPANATATAIPAAGAVAAP